MKTKRDFYYLLLVIATVLLVAGTLIYSHYH